MRKFDLKVPDNRNVIEKLNDRLLQKTIELKGRTCNEGAKILSDLGLDILPCDLYNDEFYTLLESGDEKAIVEYVLSTNTLEPPTVDTLPITVIEKTLVVLDNLTRAINSVTVTLNTLTGIVTRSAAVVNATSIALQGIKIGIIFADISLAATAPTPTGTAAIFARLIQKLEKFTDKYRAEIDGPSRRFGEKGLKAAINRAAAVLLYINMQVRALQAIILVITRILESRLASQANASIDSKITFTSLEEITPGLSTLLQTVSNQSGETYRGYTIELRKEESPVPGAVKRYAVALDPYGNIAYRGASSFSSSTDILIEEVKFNLDRLIG